MSENLEFEVVADAVKPVPPSLRALKGRETPVVWVKRLAIYRSWPPSQEHHLRTVELRRGLNIVWANPLGKNPNASRLAGHGAGKSSFCRLLRYMLDDKEPGTKRFREGFQSTLGIGWALAEVYIGNQVWLVGRPIADNAPGNHSFAYLGGSLQQEFPERPPRVGYLDYTTALDAAVFGNMPHRTLAASQKQLTWAQLVQWLTRDQEAHFRGLLEWRDDDSDSGSATILGDDRANLVRLLLGLVDDKEQELLTQHAAKAAEHEAKVRERTKLEFAIERDRLALAGAIGREVGDPKDSVLQTAISAHVANLRNDADVAIKAAKQQTENETLETAVAQAQAQYEIVRSFVTAIKTELDTAEARLRGVTPAPRPQDTSSELVRSFASFVPFQDVCSHPMDEARTAQCPLARSRQEDPALKELAEVASGEQAARLGLEARRLRAEYEHRLEIASEKRRSFESAQALLKAGRSRQLKELQDLAEPALKAARIEALHQSYSKGCDDLDRLNQKLKELAVDKDALSDVLKALTKHHEGLMQKFTELFHHISQHMLDKAITGRVVFAGKAIEPRLSFEGDRDSAALNVTKWVAFDLAALALGMTTEGVYHPRFLLHDSPRESDMAPVIYGGLFLAAKELEGELGEDAPFQYIVTTTEPPPPELGKLPWLRLELDASVEADRFLGVNL